VTSDCSSASEEYPCLLWNLKGHCHSDKSTLLVFIPSLINPYPANVENMVSS